MTTHSKFLAQLETIASKAEDAHHSWNKHLALVKERNDLLQTSHEARLKPGTCTNLQALFPALERLIAIEDLLNLRNIAISKFGISTNAISIESFIMRRMAQPPVGCETVACHLISAVMAAQDSIEPVQQQFQEAEDQLMMGLDTIHSMLSSILSMFNSSWGRDMLQVLDALEQVERGISMLPGDADGDARLAMGDIRSPLWKAVQAMGNPFLKILELGRVLASLGVKMARQTLITEYFDPL